MGNIVSVCDLVTGTMLSFLKDWLGKHIKTTDKACYQHYKEAGFTAELSAAKALPDIGVDAFALAAAFLTHLKATASKDTTFSNYSPAQFKSLVEQACPEYGPKADLIFQVVDTDSSGDIDFNEFFVMLVSGPIMDQPQFAPVLWTAGEYGVSQIDVDKDHMKLFELINSVIGAMKTGDTSVVSSAI